jgi:hypothetical protein
MLSILGSVHTSVRVELHLQPRLWVVRLSCRPEGKTLTSLRIHLVSKRAIYTITMPASFRGGFVYVPMTSGRVFCHKRGSIKSAHSFQDIVYCSKSRCTEALPWPYFTQDQRGSRVSVARCVGYEIRIYQCFNLAVLSKT